MPSNNENNDYKQVKSKFDFHVQTKLNVKSDLFNQAESEKNQIILKPISYFDTTVKVITSRVIGSRRQTPDVNRLQSSHGHRLLKSDLICSD